MKKKIYIFLLILYTSSSFTINLKGKFVQVMQSYPHYNDRNFSQDLESPNTVMSSFVNNIQELLSQIDRVSNIEGAFIPNDVLIKLPECIRQIKTIMSFIGGERANGFKELSEIVDSLSFFLKLSI